MDTSQRIMDSLIDGGNKLMEAIAKFPPTFGLRAFPGKTFRVSSVYSYLDDQNRVILYTDVLGEDGVWRSFAKGTPTELWGSLSNIV